MLDAVSYSFRHSCFYLREEWYGGCPPHIDLLVRALENEMGCMHGHLNKNLETMMLKRWILMITCVMFQTHLCVALASSTEVCTGGV
jgi:hypothetical protein